ncbi:MAG: M18 family aminopeptidase [Planctomycetes bacterium]|nr:M18 family aminopeptidase [Planctomycetota bacterium]
MLPDATRALLEFIDAAPTPFHAVAEAARRLEQSGFTRLREEDAWALAPGARRYVTRNGSTLIAFVVGTGAPAEHGFRLAGAHTDSPNLRLKPQPEHGREGYRQLGVEVYGGVLLHTWFDRDLSLAGRVVVAGEAEPRLLDLRRTVARIPTIAIHLNREVNEKGFLVNKQTQLPPVVGLEPPPVEGQKPSAAWFRELLAAELGVAADAVEGFDLMFHDAVPSAASGFAGELIHAPRLDNLASTHAALEALRAAAPTPCGATRAVALYDNEEVGSESAEGAASPFLGAVLERIDLACGGGREALHRALARSHFVSADMAHAVHPHHADRHEPQHMPRLNAGPVIKINTNLRYATNAATQTYFERLCREADVPFQRFVNRTDLPCGTTIGPITAARLGIPTVDVGNPMLSMHSIREMAGSQDHPLMIRALTAHFAGALA